ncbi:biopolymer transporter ExbD [Aeoliella sp. ICT_H6.2]|uniref:Biopolymer transporter ExbD n=1 Tax=Aeoliella straminimaris TaxID=2954799 RepID=A0A9X2JH06_9BACT|nr:biopolymer transporter ExbD [Aeoliella straminimaris]MCO6045550.1 biopolymer transporter ExbD [Aeoliella straminimaris]
MKVVSAKRREVSEGDMTPMIDMVFQLIAFFMVLINFSDIDQDQRVHLPKSELAKPPEVAYEKPITLQMTADEGIILNAGASDLLSIEDLRIALMRQSQVIKAQGDDIKLSDVTVIIRADESARHGKVLEMVDAAQQAGFETFAFRGKQSQDSGFNSRE